MSTGKISLPRYIAARYISAGKRSHLVSFMSAISVAGLTLGIAVLIIVLSVMNGFDKEMRENVLGIVPHITLSTNEGLRQDNWNDVAALVLENPRVESISPLIEVAGVVAANSSSKGVLINGVDAGAELQSSVLERFMTAGSLTALHESKWGIVIGETLADRLQVQLGDTVDVFSPNISLNPITPLATFRGFTLVGVYRVGTEELDSDLAMINLSAAKALFKIRSPYNAVRIRTSDVLLAEEVRQELNAVLPAEIRSQSWMATLGSIYQNIQFSRTIISFMLWLLIGVAAFNLVVSLIMIVRDKKGDIAILRTLGASPATINSIFMWQGCFIGLIGIVSGVLLGIIGSLNISRFAAFIENRYSLQLLNAEVYPIDFLPSQIDPLDIAVVVVGVFILSMLATIYPASRAAAIQPAEALRTD